MAVAVLLPKLGLTMETGLIQEWLVEPGTPVKPGDLIMRLGTDKVDADVEAEAAGIFHPAVAAGSDLPAGTLVGWLLEPGEPVPSGDGPAAPPAETGATAAAAPAEEASGDIVVGEPGALTPPPHTGRQFASPLARRLAGERGIDIATLKGTGPGGRVIKADVLDAVAAKPSAPAPSVASPLVRRAAAVAGIDLATVTPSGPAGRILRADVAAAAAKAAAQPPVPSGAPAVAPAAVLSAVPAVAPAPGEVIPLSGMRGVIASRMLASLHEMAQLTLGTEATMDAAVALRAQIKEQWSAAGLPVPTITDLIVRAAALALRDHPRLNASVQGNEIHVQTEINIGVAVALADGLVVPVVRNADQLPVSAIAAQTRRLAQDARTGHVKLPDLEGGTFTVSTLGSYGVDFFTPVITPGQVAILGVGRLRDSVRWEGSSPVRTQVLTLSLTFDHRAVDGAPAADYLRSVVSRLANPLSLLA
ncbi:MAG TPA: 2-oxo acid dehydrogenase subunit E2 [Kribbellaceae bacterium]